MNRSITVLILLWMMGISFVYAEEAEWKRAEELLRAGQAEEAYQLLAPLETELAGSVEFDYMLGIAALDSGRVARAMFALERVLAVNPDHQQARAEIARAHFLLGENESARQEFKNVLERQPPEEAIDTINRYMSAIDQVLGERSSFGAYLEFALGRDSNINGAPNAQSFTANVGGIPLPVTLSGNAAKLSDNFGTLSGGANFQYPFSKSWSMTGGVSGNQRKNWTTGSFRTVGMDINLGLKHTLGGDTYTAVLQGDAFDLDDSAYRRTRGVTTQWQHDLDDRNQVNMSAQVSRLTYPTASFRDADRKILGAGYGHAFQGDMSPVIFLNGYAGSEDEFISGHPDLGHQLQGIKLGGQLVWNPAMVLFASLAYEKRDYGGTKPFFGVAQRDRQYEVSIGARYLPMAGWQIKPQVIYVDNRSNIPLTRYDRLFLSLSVRHDFGW